MRRPVVIAIRSGYVLLILLLILLVLPALQKAKRHSGPDPRQLISTRLQMIEHAKDILKQRRRLPDDYWPTRAEIAEAHSGRTNAWFSSVFAQTSWGEIYIVNRIGAPAYAYLSNAVAELPEGYLLTSDEVYGEHNKVGAANGSQPIRSETNSTSSAAGSRR